jgi:hypothetical protein
LLRICVLHPLTVDLCPKDSKVKPVGSRPFGAVHVEHVLADEIACFPSGIGIEGDILVAYQGSRCLADVVGAERLLPTFFSSYLNLGWWVLGQRLIVLNDFLSN